MMELADRKELSKYCRMNEEYLKGPVRSVVLEFQGLNRYEYFEQLSCDLELELADTDILYVIPYTAPWSWMNSAAVRYTDWLLDNLFRLLEIPAKAPVISTGFSMGGLAALMYPTYSARLIAACMSNSPTCDLILHLAERPDLPRTIVNAFINHPEGLDSGIRSRSPIHQVDKLRDIPYFVIAGDMDREVIKSLHSDRLVEAMLLRGLNVIYRQLPTMRHWQINDYATLREAISFVKGGYAQMESGA